ncbi:E3 ubiquitin-protein ligase hrd-1-like [Pogoniulus pusillus]|uniref:E3 ubiquitin-protein ligase hrd-1-like n=1 Tax=Pogoniulus pusillus TaxID=488313 RepID=UPI0030B9924A
MASELDTTCPICLDSWEEDASLVLPCLHRFCYACIKRWAGRRSACPLCKRGMASIVHGVRADDSFEEDIISAPAAPPATARQAGAAPARGAAAARAVPVVPGAAPGGLRPSAWAALFREHPALLQPVRAWLRRELRRLFGRRLPRAELVEDLVVPLLVLFGLDAEMLQQLLLVSLGGHTEAFVTSLIAVAVQRCSAEAMRLLGPQGGPAANPNPAEDPRPAVFRRGSATPAAAPSSSRQGRNAGDLPSPSAAARPGRAGSAPSAPLPSRGEPGERRQDAGEAGPSPSTSAQGTERARGGPRRPPKRRAGSPHASAPSKRKPPNGQH